MSANTYLHYENATFPEESYGFEIDHQMTTAFFDYMINTTPRNFEYNESEALKSIVLGTLISDRTGLATKLRETIENRLDELLDGYGYKFELSDCCGPLIEINAGEEPEGRIGIAKYYILGDSSRAEMKLTVWR
jgi:hypothetical protein